MHTVPPVNPTAERSAVGVLTSPSVARSSVARPSVITPPAPVWDAPAAPEHVGGARSWRLLHSDLSLDDVHGLRGVKRRLRATLRHTDRATRTGRAAGLLLFGPQGCGRTMLVRAAAGDFGGTLIRLSIPDLVERAARTADPAESVALELTAMFVAARRTPSAVVVLDDIDALAPDAEADALVWAAADAVVARLTAELDGREPRPGRVLLIGSTDRPWLVPPALRGSDRLGPELYVGPPDRAARRAVLQSRLTGSSVGVINLPRLVCSTSGLSASELVWVCTRARALAAWDELTGRGAAVVGMPELAAAISEVRPGAPLWCAERLVAARRSRAGADLPLSALPARS